MSKVKKKYMFYVQYNTINPEHSGNASVVSDGVNATEALYNLLQVNCFPPVYKNFVQVNSVKLINEI